MKTKLLLAMSLAALTLCGTAQAATITVPSEGIKDLSAAIGAAQNGDEIVITEDQTITSRLNIDAKTSLTIKGATGTEKIIRKNPGWSGSSQTLLLIRKKTTITFQNLVIDGGNYGTSNAGQLPILIEETGTTALFDNVTFTNHTLKNADMAIINPTKQNSKVTLTNCTFTGNTIPSGSGDVLTDGSVTITGNTSASFILKNASATASVKVGDAYTGQSTLAFTSTVTDIADNTVVVTGATTGFALNNMPSYELVANNGNLEIVKKHLEDKAVVNETTFTGYDTLEAALAALESGKPAVILIQKPITVTQQISNTNGANLTIKGPEGGVTITRGFEGNNGSNDDFWISSSKDMFFENITFDENHVTNKRGVVNVNRGTSVWLTNVKFINSNCEWELIFEMPNNNSARVLLNNVFCENCPDNKGMVKFNKQVLIYGETNLKLRVAAKEGYTITVDPSVTDIQTPIAIDFEKPAYEPAKDADVVLVHDCTQPSWFSVPEGFALEAKDGNLVVTSSTSTIVESIDVDNNAPAEYYNLQGIKVQNPVAGQIYIVKQGSKTSKVVF